MAVRRQPKLRACWSCFCWRKESSRRSTNRDTTVILKTLQFENPDLWNFKPDIVFIHTTWHNVSEFPELLEAEAEVEQRVRREMARFESLWEKIHTELGALIIQNNFDLPRLRPLGNLEASEVFGRVNFVLRLNAEFASYARNHSHLLDQ